MSLQVSKLKKKRTTIMKKIYQNPKTKIVTISVTQLMTTASNGILGDDPTKASFDLNDVNSTGETSGNLSRRNDIWEEDEEDGF
jgi:hypothetical protein